MSLLSEFIDDLHAAIQDAGYFPGEFEFDEEEADEPAGSGRYDVYTRSYITITRTSTGDCNRYHAGHGLDFPMPFINDLNEGFFGDP